MTPAAIFLLVLIACAHYSDAANILVYSGICTASHINSLVPVMDRLAERGHNVTLHTPYRPSTISSNVTVVFAEEIFNVFRDQWDEGADLIQIRAAGISLWDGLVDNALHVCRTFFEAPSSQALIHSSQFDLVIVDASFNEVAVGLAHLKYKCPHILYSAPSPMPNFHDEFGFPIESGIPDMESGAKGGDSMSFWNRLFTIWLPIKWLWRRHVNYYPKMNALLKEQLGLHQEPDMANLQTKASLMLLNTHYSADFTRSMPPFVVPIGGIGLSQKPGTLPADLQDFLSGSASKGFIYVCFGTAVQIAKSDPALRAKLFSAFASFQHLQFVWKWEGDIPRRDEQVPENIYFAPWLPQQDLFSDKRIRGFIGHGGMNGIAEAIHFAVPIILFPIFGDQDHNARALEAKELATILEITDFTQAELVQAISKLLNDKKLHARVQLASRVARDRPQSPLDTAVWWIEYVLRHGDAAASFLRPRNVHQPWYTKRWLDVWLTVFATATVGVLLLVTAAWWIIGSKRDTVIIHANGSNGYGHAEDYTMVTQVNGQTSHARANGRAVRTSSSRSTTKAKTS